MGVPLYLLISGDVLFLGLAVVMAGVAAAGRYPRSGAAALWCGLILALVSAVPIHPGAYGALLLAGIAFEGTRRYKASAGRLATVAMFVSVVAISGIAIRWRQTTGSALPKDLPVFVIGDSLSAGLGPSPAGTWPHLLSQRLGLRVSNLSQAGATLSNSVQHVRSVPAERAIVIVELGGNDILGGTSPEQFASDLRTLLGALTTGDRRVVMFELPLLPFQNSYGRIQRRLCARYGVDLIPRRVLAEAITRRGNSADGLHLAPQGHSWLAERIAHSWSNSFRNVSIR